MSLGGSVPPTWAVGHAIEAAGCQGFAARWEAVEIPRLRIRAPATGRLDAILHELGGLFINAWTMWDAATVYTKPSSHTFC